MKTRLAYPPFLTGLLTLVWLVTGCTQQSVGNTAPVITSAPPAAIVAQTTSAKLETAAPPAAEIAAPTATTKVPPLIITNATATTNAELAVTNTPQTVPQDVRISNSLNQVIRMSGAGVDEAIIL